MSSERAAKLSKTEIIQTALILAQDVGVDAVSFRRLAAQLQVSPMALYRYYDDKQALLAAMLDKFIEDANVLPGTTHTTHWQHWISHVTRHMYQALMSQPTWLPLLGQLPLQSSGLAVLDACLEKLIAAGFNREQAVRAFFSMIQVLFGAAISQQQLQHDSTTNIDNDKNFNSINAAELELLQVMQEEQIEIGLQILMAGLEQQLAQKEV